MLMHTLIPNVRLPINQPRGEISRVTVTEEELVVFLNSAFVLCWGSELHFSSRRTCSLAACHGRDGLGLERIG